MADSSTASAADRQTSYYCHNCKCRNASITESFTCPRCNSGFIEEVENNNSQQQDNSNDVFSFFTSSGDLQDENVYNLLNDMNLFNNFNNVQLGRLLSTVIGSQGTNQPFIRLLHGNPEDYVWSTDGLDTVITQLLNQIDNAGPPPMSQEDINNLNEISVSKDHVNNKLQCPICMEDFILDEKVKELSCHHFFHNDCIVNWLKLHATCPTCRTVLANEENTTKANAENSHTTSVSNSTSRPENTATSSNSTHNQTSSGGYDFTDDLD